MATQEPLMQWATIAPEFDPNNHMMQFERFDKKLNRKVITEYLTVPNRLIWFIKDQRMLIAAGLGQTSYVIQTDLVEHDREAGWAHFKTYVRDVLGNEATMYGSESVRDFPDYIEKASTKSVGRALLMLGYGTQFAPELDEGEDRPVDSPAPRQQPQQKPTPMRPAGTAPDLDTEMMTALRDLAAKLNHKIPENLTAESAADLGRKWKAEWKAKQ